MTLPTDQRHCRNSRGTASPTTARARRAGEYSFEAIANVGGKSDSLELLLASRVNSVTIDSQAPDSH